MNCTQAQDRMDEFATGDLYGTEEARVRLHLNRCYTCREEHDVVAELLEDCRRILRHPHPTNRFAELRLTMETEARRNDSKSARSARRLNIVSRLPDWRCALRSVGAMAAAVAALCFGPWPRSTSILFMRGHSGARHAP